MGSREVEDVGRAGGIAERVDGGDVEGFDQDSEVVGVLLPGLGFAVGDGVVGPGEALAVAVDVVFGGE